MALLRIPGRFKFPVTQSEWRALIGAFTGDSGSGGTLGLVPAPATGDASAAKFLKADGTWAVPAGGGSSGHGQCFLAKSSSNLVLSPKNGNQLIINGTAQAVPDAGVSLSTSGLSSSTLYYIYAYMNSGTMTLEASATAYAVSTTSGNKGIVIKSGADTRTLVGMARTNGSTAWVDSDSQRFVRSYFNEDGVSTKKSFTASRNTTSTTFVEANSEIRNEALLWSGEKWHLALGGGGYNSAAGNAVWIAFALDGTTAESGAPYFNGAGVNYANTLGGAICKTGLSEGYHYATLLLAVSAGTGTLGGIAPFSATITTLSGRTMK